MTTLHVVQSKRGVPAIIVHEYKYTKCNILNTSDIIWKCPKKTCYASIKTNDKIELLESRGIHNHSSLSSSDIEILKIDDVLKRKAIEDPTVRPSKIIRKAIATSENVNMNDISNFRRRIYRQRRKNQPVLPISTEDAVQQLNVKQNEIQIFKHERCTMSSKNSKPRGGSCCAVVNCGQYSGKAKKNESNISFHRFPKDIERQKIWVHRCKRGDKWNPQSSTICSMHFTSDDFVRDLKAELLGYSPKVRKLKPDAVPTLNLPVNSFFKNETTSAINRKNRMDAKLAKQVHDELISSSLSSTSLLPPATVSISMCNDDMVLPKDESSTMDYEKLYNDLLKEYNILKTENKKQEVTIQSLKLIINNYVKINENIRTNMIILQKKYNETDTLFKKSVKNMAKEVKILSLNKTKTIEREARKLVSPIFTPNQFNLIIKKQKRVHWTRDEVTKALKLWSYSKKAYIFVKYDLQYPLPGMSSLERWTKMFKMKNIIINPDVSNTIDDNIEEIIVDDLTLANTSTNDESFENEVIVSYTDTASGDECQVTHENNWKKEMELNSLECLAGWVANKYKSTMPYIECTATELNKTKTLPRHNYIMPPWINHLSRDELIDPSDSFKEIIFRTERLFNKFTKFQIPKGSNVIANLTNKIFSRMSVANKFKRVIRTYIEQRSIIRLKYFKFYSRSHPIGP